MLACAVSSSIQRCRFKTAGWLGESGGPGGSLKLLLPHVAAEFIPSLTDMQTTAGIGAERCRDRALSNEAKVRIVYPGPVTLGERSVLNCRKGHSRLPELRRESASCVDDSPKEPVIQQLGCPPSGSLRALIEASVA